MRLLQSRGPSRSRASLAVTIFAAQQNRETLGVAPFGDLIVPEDKPAQRERVIYEFGILVSPLVDLAKREAPPEDAEYRIAVAKSQAGDAEWRRTVRDFTTLAQDVVLEKEYQEISHVPERLFREVADVIRGQAHDAAALHAAFKDLVATAQERFFRFLRRVPVEWKPRVFEANTPFTAYRRIQMAVAPARARVHYFDRYLKPAFFDLFLSRVDPGIEVRLVTTEIGVKAVAAVSELVAAEFADYRLLRLGPEHFHDRNLRVDNAIFSLGPGVDRAGLALTNFGPAEDTEAAHAAFDKLIDAAENVH